MISRFRKITKDLYRGSAPSIKDVVKLHKLIGIKKIISLDANAGLRIERICKLLGIHQIIIPLDGTRKSLLNLLQYDLKELLLDGGPTFIHCQHGKDRTGFVTALFKCKYMGWSAEEALEEARKLGFGVGVPETFIAPFEDIIRKSCNKDNNNADIVSNERDYVSDSRSSALDHADRGSFSPYLEKTKQDPYDQVYNYSYDQEPTRDNINSKQMLPPPEGDVPMVGMNDNTSGINGAGPIQIGNGFLNV